MFWATKVPQGSTNVEIPPWPFSTRIPQRILMASMMTSRSRRLHRLHLLRLFRLGRRPRRASRRPQLIGSAAEMPQGLPAPPRITPGLTSRPIVITCSTSTWRPNTRTTSLARRPGKDRPCHSGSIFQTAACPRYMLAPPSLPSPGTTTTAGRITTRDIVIRRLPGRPGTTGGSAVLHRQLITRTNAWPGRGPPRLTLGNTSTSLVVRLTPLVSKT